MIFANIDLANRKRHAALRPFNMDKVHESVSKKFLMEEWNTYYIDQKSTTV
jgi:hypothetical protein